MRQALGNLFSNALRHTPADGTVPVTVRQTGDLAVLTVEDTGSGTVPEDLPHVLERFWRAEKMRRIGCAVVRRHNAFDITFDSRLSAARQ
jgi:two-component system sensor histidine kinase BaeS